MSITIRKGPFGWYVDQPGCTRDGFGDPIAETDPEARKKRILYLECTLKGFDPFPKNHDCRFMKTVEVDNVDGRRYTLYFDPTTNLLKYVNWVKGGTFCNTDTAVELAEDNGVWHFLVGKEYTPPQYPTKS